MLEIKNISKSFGSQQVLKDINLCVPNNTIQFLLGANGAGKSTLLKIVADYISCDHGAVFIDGLKITPREFKYRSRIGYLLDEEMYLNRLSAMEYLEFVGSFYPLAYEVIHSRARDLIAFFELDSKKKLIQDYSKGMKKKVALAAALIHHPKYLILDEPFESMDFLSVQKTSNLFQKLAANGAVILITSHQYDAVAEICDKIALLKDGKILFNYSFKELEEIASKALKQEKNPVKVYLEMELKNDRDDAMMAWI
jgi:ABC-2 type transport system ATP-binding protein